jgi:hypothetical protein
VLGRTIQRQPSEHDLYAIPFAGVTVRGYDYQRLSQVRPPPLTGVLTFPITLLPPKHRLQVSLSEATTIGGSARSLSLSIIFLRDGAIIPYHTTATHALLTGVIVNKYHIDDIQGRDGCRFCVPLSCAPFRLEATTVHSLAGSLSFPTVLLRAGTIVL